MKNETAASLLGMAAPSNIGAIDHTQSDAALMEYCDTKFAELMHNSLNDPPMSGVGKSDPRASDHARRSFFQKRQVGRGLLTHAAPLRVHKKGSPTMGLGPRVYIGFDAEWQYVRKGRNRVLSVQFCLVGPTGDAMHKVIHLVGSDGDAERPRLAQAIYDLLDEAEDDGVIEDWPIEVVLCGFFTRADITVFSDFKQFRQELSGLGGTLVTVGDPVGIELPMSERRQQQLKSRYQYVVDPMFDPKLLSIRLVDSSRLAPPGKSLAYLGKVLGLPNGNFQASCRLI